MQHIRPLGELALTHTYPRAHPNVKHGKLADELAPFKGTDDHGALICIVLTPLLCTFQVHCFLLDSMIGSHLLLEQCSSWPNNIPYLGLTGPNIIGQQYSSTTKSSMSLATWPRREKLYSHPPFHSIEPTPVWLMHPPHRGYLPYRVYLIQFIITTKLYSIHEVSVQNTSDSFVSL